MLTKIKSFMSVVKADLADTWKRSKIFLLALLGIVIALEFRKLKEFLLVYMGQKEIKDDQKKDKDLAEKEKNANDQADALVKKANEESANEKPITDDWNKK